jgi:voltage-gated potassium channel
MNPTKSRLKGFIIALVLVIIMGSIGFMSSEKLSLWDSIYFSIVTISTVGYGDAQKNSAYGTQSTLASSPSQQSDTETCTP